ncbi:hypothetical protein [Streptomyces sp. NPDC060194]|uniref:hypothetical protein n=1 Tax=Streptomyces sp. NPDC060194 TaxID=3347069 RepID=UPI003657EF3B
MSHLIRRATATLVALLLCLAGLTALAAPTAASVPATSSSIFPNGTVTAAYSDTTLDASDPFTVTVTFQNTSASAQDVAYEFSPRDGSDPALFVYDSCTLPNSPTGSCSSTGRIVRAQFTGLPAGQTAVVTVNAHIDAATPADSYDVFQSGTVGTSSRKDFNPGIVVTVLPPAAADLGVALTATAGPLLSSQIGYAATVTNKGPGAATASTTTVALPIQTTSVTGLSTGCTYASGPRTVTCNSGPLANGASATRTFTANLGLLSLGPLNATATRTSSTPNDPNPANDTATTSCTVLTGLIITCP